MSLRVMISASFLALLLFVSGMPVFAQAGSVALSGQVKDPTALAVAGAKVNAINVGTNVGYPTQTNETGLYNLPSLPPGKYRIEVEKEGFQRIVKPDVELHVAETVSIDFSLQVGAVAQTVTVQGGAPLVNTTTSSLGGLVQEQELEALPLNGRNYIGLTLMQPGVTPDVNEQKNGVYSGSWFSSNGAPIRSNNFLLDGAIMQDQNAGSTADFAGRTLGLDGIQEYRVITNSIPAEYGLLMGSQTVMASRSGTNQFHGNAFDYLRNSVLDAPNYFDKPLAANNFHDLPEYRRNNFGAAFGGPIKKDKTFFYANYEGVKEGLGVTNIENVPAATCHGPAGAVVWNGSGAQPAGSIGPCTQLGANPGGAGTNSVRISAVTAPLLVLYPIPNLPNNQETVPYSQPDSDNFGQIRVDHTFSDKDSIFGRYTIDDDDIVLSLPYSQYFENPKLTRHQYVTLSENHIFSPTLLNNVRVSFSRTADNRFGTDPLTGSQYEFVGGSAFPGIGQLNVGGLTLFGSSASPRTLQKQNIITGSDDVTYTHGNHSLKFGASVNRFRTYGLNPTGSQGTIIFGGLATFLEGEPSSYSGITPGSVLDRTYQYYDLGFYAQDDWRLRRNFTLNVGLRYEPAPNYYNEVHGISSTLVNRLTDATPTIGPLFGHNPTLHNFSPRLGFAWDVFGNGKTAVRGGAALLYDISNLVAAANLTKSQPPFSTSVSVSGTTSNPIILTSLPLTFPSTTASTSSTLFANIDYNLQQPRMYTENLTVEQQLPFSMVLGVSYAGARGIHLIADQEGNPDVPQADPGVPGGLFWPANTVRENPHWSSMTWTAGNRDSVYNALEVNVTKRLSKGLEFQSAYTWAKSIDDAQGEVSDCTASTAVGSDPYNFGFDRSQSCFNAINTWVFNFIYTLPTFGIEQPFLKAIANGWGVMGIYTAHNGFPFNPWETTERARTGVLAGAANPPVDRPDWVSGRNPYNATRGTSTGCGTIPAGTPLGSPTLYFDPCAFMLQPVGTLGNVGRDSLIGPGFSNLDFAIQKDTKPHILGERGDVQFRAEFFNILNHPNFNEPSEAVFAGTLTDVTETPTSSAGQITSTVSTSRQIELSLRVIF